MLGKKKPEDLTEEDLQQIVDRMMEFSTFRILMAEVVRRAFIENREVRQIVVDKVNIILDEIFINEDNIENIKKSVIQQIDEMHSVRILLDQIQRNSKKVDSK